mmetsp:Transcript_24505/g.37120  ORF Transcript_24505/g.37120 Transcript_24505/m.37120 type:complete len:158 (-) Transcript_24505:243-716(-)
MARNTITAVFPLLLILLSIASSTFGFTANNPSQKNQRLTPPSARYAAASSTEGGGDPSEVIARKITVCGDVDGGYYRSCVKNEGSRFRKLSGTMSPPDDSKKAEILVEGRRKMVDGFVRWCERGNVGLSQRITVESVKVEDPTGLYDDFYVPTGRDN